MHKRYILQSDAKLLLPRVKSDDTGQSGFVKFHRMCRLFDIIDAFVSPSRFTACLLEQSGVPSNKVHVIPTFVPWYENKENKKPVEPFVLYLGRISPEKGVDILIKAALSNPSLKVKITGKIDDAYSQSMVKLVEDAGESDRIEFVGFVNGDSKNQLIDEASCVVCPSTWYENMPNAVLEAFAHANLWLLLTSDVCRKLWKTELQVK